jgi:hypothetical protein
MSLLVMAAAGAVFVRRVHEATVLIRAVSFKLGGLAQPGIDRNCDVLPLSLDDLLN